MKTLTEYANDVMKNKNNPSMLSELGVELAGKYAYMSEFHKNLQLEKAVFWNKKFYDGEKEREKPLSDTHLGAMWLQEEGGKKEIRLKAEMKALEKLLSAIKSSIVVSSNEARNQF